MPELRDNDFDDILNRIYEAALVPTEWPNTLEMISQAVGGIGGVLYTLSEHKTLGIVSPSIEDICAGVIKAGWAEKNFRLERVLERALFGVTVSEQDLFTEDELRDNPMYEYLRSVGAGWCAGFLAEVPTGDSFVFSIERAYTQGPFVDPQIKFIESLRPHVSRAALLTARIGLERVHAAVEAMGLIGLPTAVISLRKKLIAANDLLSELIPSMLVDAPDRVHLVNPTADQMMLAALTRLSTDARLENALSIPVPGSEGRSPLVIHIVPIRRAAHDLFSNALCLFVVTALARKGAPSASVIQGLFDLTATEAKIVIGLANGLTLQEIADRYGNKVGTVRTQLKQIFAKTGLRRQTDLAALLAAISI